MAKNTGTGPEHLATGTLPHRALKVFAERFGKAMGSGVAGISSSYASTTLRKIKDRFNITVPDAIFAITGDVGAVFLQDPIVWRALVGMFGMSEDLAKELTNEGLDQFIGGYMDRVRDMKGESGKALDDALASEADIAVEQIKKEIAAKHPELIRKVWYHRRMHVAHAVGCENLKWLSHGVDKGTNDEGISFAEVLKRGGRMTTECECSDERPFVIGSLQKALSQSHPCVREAFDRMLLSEALKAERSKILEAGRKRTDISPEDLAEVVESAEELRAEKLRALVGVQAQEAVKAPSRFQKFLDKLGERAAGVGEHLTAPPDDPKRVAWREKMDRETELMREETQRRRAFWDKK